MKRDAYLNQLTAALRRRSGGIGSPGVSGDSGYSGYSGFSGMSGYSGYSGFSGISGYSSFSGISGYSGYSGLSGYSGYSGYSGPAGPSGYSGFSGYSGYSGGAAGGSVSASPFYLDDGTFKYGPMFQLTPPVNGDFSWANQGGATATVIGGGVTLIAPPSAGNNIRMRVKSIPSAPYIVTLGFIPHLFASQDIGMVLRKSGTGELIRFDNGVTTQLLILVQRFDSPTAFNSTSASINPAFLSGFMWLQIEDDSANRIFRVSYDGATFTTVLSEANNAFITPDEIGFFANDFGNTYQSVINVLHWDEA